MREAQARQGRTTNQAEQTDAARGEQATLGRGEEKQTYSGSDGNIRQMTPATKAEPPENDISAPGGYKVQKPLDSGRSNIAEPKGYKTTADNPAGESLGKEEAVKGAETFGKTVAETEGELAPVDAAEAALPGVGEVLMGLTAIGGLVRGAIKEHQEKKAMEADAPVAPATPNQQAQGGQKSGIGFSSAPVIDSSDYHHL